MREANFLGDPLNGELMVYLTSSVGIHLRTEMKNMPWKVYECTRTTEIER